MLLKIVFPNSFVYFRYFTTKKHDYSSLVGRVHLMFSFDEESTIPSFCLLAESGRGFRMVVHVVRGTLFNFFNGFCAGEAA